MGRGEGGSTLEKAVPLILAAARITTCSAGLLMERSLATTGARGFRLGLLRAPMVSHSDLGSGEGDKYFKMDLGEDLREEGLKMSTYMLSNEERSERSVFGSV